MLMSILTVCLRLLAVTANIIVLKSRIYLLLFYIVAHNAPKNKTKKKIKATMNGFEAIIEKCKNTSQ